ncbi:MAG: hypothetical protein KAX18_01615 [Candidatus Lokiarchaeota archaeon]|nr:hypothetical protein [Candidatus Lokiarchaeota archaeon]
MPYHLKVLILGDPDIIHLYASRAFGEPGEDNDTYFEWYREVKVLEDTCSLEIDAVTSISADLDEILEIVDGIVYFLNPLNKDESELFEMVLPDIFAVKREIPTVVIFYDQNGILPLSVNDLLTNVWVSFPSLEAFVNLKPKEFHQALQSLCLAIINGDTPLNIENAWMRFPIFIQMANVYFNNNNYYYAAQAVKKAALIAEIYNKEEFYILLDQAANLFSKINLYLEASNILEKIDKKKSQNFKKLYADAMIREGNISFNKQEFETAASQYERAGQWASIEMLDEELVRETFRLAINSWISACQVEKAFKILENLDHAEVQNILKSLSEKIGAAADFLVGANKFELAKEQLYIAINKYQREALSDELKFLTNKLTEILIQIFKIQVEASESYAAKYTYDEIENMWDPTSYKVEKTDLDSILKILINSFLEKNNFRMAATLINKLNSLMLKQDLSKISGDLEDKYKDSIKKEIEDYIKKGEEILAEFVKAELDIITEMNRKKIEEASMFTKQNQHLKAGTHLLNHANHLKKIGKEDIRDQILTKSLDIFLEGEIFKEFFITFNSLSKEMKKKYLIRIFQIFLDKLKGIEKLEDYERREKILEDSNRIYRNHLLYDESKEISIVFIKNIQNEALAILNDEENTLGIKRANVLVKKATDILDAYLDKEERAQVNFDKIYKKISEIYIKLDDLPSANTYNDLIENKAVNTEIHKKIAKLEALKSEKRTKKAEESREGEVLKEQLSIIKSKAREAKLDQKNEFRERKSYRKAYFQGALNHFTNQEFEESIILYQKSITKLNKIKKYNLAGVSLAVVSLLLIKENRFEEIKKLLEKIKEELSGLGEWFSKTFPVTLIVYIIQVRKFQNEDKLNEAISFIENLPLFEEELKLLKEVLGETVPEEETEEKHSRKEKGELDKLEVEMKQRFGKIQSMRGDVNHEKNEFFIKRKAMRRLYYSEILNMLEEPPKFKDAATKYYDLAIKLVKRKDLRTSSLLILLHGLCLLKEEESSTIIKKNIDKFLNSLGVNKNLVKDTFYIMVILFIIDVKIYSLDKYLPKIIGMLEILPLFEEEEQLIDIQ